MRILNRERFRGSGKFKASFLFDYDFIDAHRQPNRSKMTWKALAEYYGCSLQRVSSWYNAEKERRQNQTVREYRKKNREKKQKSIRKEKFKALSDSKKRIIEIALPKVVEDPTDRTTRYGSIKPTGYKWNDDSVSGIIRWAKKYTQYNWDNENIRENISTLYIDVFVNGLKAFIFKPRSSGKTKSSIIVYAFILANTYLPQLIIVNGQKSKKRIFYALRHILHSPVFRNDYGDIIEKESIQDGDMRVYRYLVPLQLGTIKRYVTDDPNIQISSWAGIIGSHPYIAYMEDILQSEYKNTESNEYMLEEVYDSIIANMTERIGGTATRKGETDLYSYLPLRGFKFVVKKALTLISGRFPTMDDAIFDENGTLIGCNITGEFDIIERPSWTIEKLLVKYLTNPHKFAREMQNEVLPPAGRYFDTDSWRTQKANLTILKEVRIGNIPSWAFVDPAYGSKTSADFTSIIIVIVLNEELHIIAGCLRKGVKDIPSLISEYEVYNPIYTCIDDNWNQLRLSQSTSEYLSVKNLLPYTTRIPKVDRITGLYRWFRRIVIWDSFEQVDEAYKQFIEFNQRPSDELRKDDFLDTLAMAVEKLKHRLDSTQAIRVWTM